MALCDTCKNYNKLYDEFRQRYDDCIEAGEDKVKHHCPMYNDFIPSSIFDNNGDCEFYIKNDEKP